MKQVAIIQFPGLNCEAETLRSIEASGLKAVLVRWNQKRNLDQFDAFVIPGGFSYEDRSRAGVIAALDPIMDKLKKQEQKGKPILGICNGAQILVESGLVPGFDDYRLGMALAINKRVKDNKVLGTGFYNTWVNIKSSVQPERTPFTYGFNQSLHLPIAHGEGRFLMVNDLLQQLQENEQIVFYYCDAQGQIKDQYPINPNGSTKAIAGLCNQTGNVLALMPHPERSALGFGRELFQSLKKYFNGAFKLKTPNKRINYQLTKQELIAYERPNNCIEFFVDLIITDNEAVSVQNALNLQKINVNIQKKIYWQVEIGDTQNIKKTILELIKSSELLNNNKETAQIKFANQYFQYNKNGGLKEIYKLKGFNQPIFLVFYQDNFIGHSKLSTLRDKLGFSDIIKVKKGILWQVDKTDKINQVLLTNIFYNPFSQICYQYQQ